MNYSKMKKSDLVARIEEREAEIKTLRDKIEALTDELLESNEREKEFEAEVANNVASVIERLRDAKAHLTGAGAENTPLELAKMIRYNMLELDDTLTSCLNAHYRSDSRYSVNGVVEKARMLNQIMLGYQG